MPVERAVVLFLWGEQRILRLLRPDEADPDQGTLDALADAYVSVNGGVRPVVRLLEGTRVPESYGVGTAGEAAGASGVGSDGAAGGVPFP